MMVEKPDWTGQLGQAFIADKDAVFASIQRLRTKAQAAGMAEYNPDQTWTIVRSEDAENPGGN
jgi:hypothetical protein